MVELPLLVIVVVEAGFLCERISPLATVATTLATQGEFLRSGGIEVFLLACLGIILQRAETLETQRLMHVRPARFEVTNSRIAPSSSLHRRRRTLAHPRIVCVSKSF